LERDFYILDGAGLRLAGQSGDYLAGRYLGLQHLLRYTETPVNLALLLNVNIEQCRAIYRVIEFSGAAASSYITQHEWLFWTCEALPMLCK